MKTSTKVKEIALGVLKGFVSGILPGVCLPFNLDRFFDYESPNNVDHSIPKIVTIMLTSMIPGISLITSTCIGTIHGIHQIKLIERKLERIDYKKIHRENYKPVMEEMKYVPVYGKYYKEVEKRWNKHLKLRFTD